MEWLLSGLAVSLFVAVVSFFAQKVIAIAKQMAALHDFVMPQTRMDIRNHVTTELKSLEQVQQKVDEIYERQTALVAHAQQLEKLHSKMATVAMNVQALDVYIKGKCGES